MLSGFKARDIGHHVLLKHLASHKAEVTEFLTTNYINFNHFINTSTGLIE
jgi:hypothetical protein